MTPRGLKSRKLDFRCLRLFFFDFKILFNPKGFSAGFPHTLKNFLTSKKEINGLVLINLIDSPCTKNYNSRVEIKGGSKISRSQKF